MVDHSTQTFPPFSLERLLVVEPVDTDVDIATAVSCYKKYGNLANELILAIRERHNVAKNMLFDLTKRILLYELASTAIVNTVANSGKGDEEKGSSLARLRKAQQDLIHDPDYQNAFEVIQRELGNQSIFGKWTGSYILKISQVLNYIKPQSRISESGTYYFLDFDGKGIDVIIPGSTLRYEEKRKKDPDFLSVDGMYYGLLTPVGVYIPCTGFQAEALDMIISQRFDTMCGIQIDSSTVSFDGKCDLQASLSKINLR